VVLAVLSKKDASRNLAHISERVMVTCDTCKRGIARHFRLDLYSALGFMFSTVCSANVSKRSKMKEKATMTILYRSGMVENKSTYEPMSKKIR
jgi:hypothetical protein